MMAEAFAQLPNGAKDIEPFNFNIPDQDIEDLKQLLKLSKVAPDTFENTQEDGRYGVTAKWLSEAKDYWLSTYDWGKTEDHINSFPLFLAQITHEGNTYPIHFTALFSTSPTAVPVISTHGWPGSFLEYLPMASLIKDKYPSPSSLPFHLIIPSLPGYGLSPLPSPSINLNVMQSSHLLHLLMHDHLRFPQYIATGGDIGSGVARILAAKYDACVGMQINFCQLQTPCTPIDDSTLTDFEKGCVERGREFFATGAAYAMEQGTRPGTLGLVLSSSPLALLAWVGEKFLSWSDTPKPSLGDILDQASLWWFTGRIASSFYPYRQRFESAVWGHGHPELRVEGKGKAFGYQVFPKEINPVPRSWAETTGELTWFQQHESGGHFAAMERPGEMLGDLEDFLRHVVEEKGWRFGK